MPDSLLSQSLGRVRRRLVSIGIAAGAGWALTGTLLLLVLFAWVDLALDLPPTVRAICGAGSLIFGMALLLRAAAMAIRDGAITFLARRVDRVAQTGGQVLTGVDLGRQYSGSAAATSGLSHGLARMAIERAAQIASRVNSSAAVPARPLAIAYLTFGGLALLVGIIALSAPRLVAAQWLRLTDPFADHPPYSSIELQVRPGDTRVSYGSSLDVRATPAGGTVERMDLVFRPSSGSAEESIPMFPEPGGAWRATIADVTAAGHYYVKAPGARSRRFTYEVITVPELRDVRFRVTLPAYTHRPPYEGPVPHGGLSGLPGTRVELWATSNRPLSGGMVEFEPDAAPTTQSSDRAGSIATLMPVSSNAPVVTGSFLIDRPGKIKVTVSDVAGQASRQPFATPVTVLADQQPFVRILEPRPESFATPDATMDVQIVAEDDYGISRLQLFRGLDDSRVLATDIPVPPAQPTRFPADVPVKLSDYGLLPGDAVKLYARVEDNDPAGAKGSETSVVLVHIISQEDFDRMLLAREGLEELEAKYAQALRRLEATDDRVARMQEELRKLPADSPLAQEKRREIEKLSRQMDQDAQDVTEAASEKLPFDIDKNLRRKLDEVADAMHRAADAARQVATRPGLRAGDADKELQAIRDQLGVQRKDFQENAADPLEHLAKVYPLIEDEARFVELWQRQRDLAERMRSTQDARSDDPAAKARMRDLETEQRQLRQGLQDLLADIEDHAAALPPDPKPQDPDTPGLDKLRASAQEFVRAARQSGALEQMADSEQNLQDFAGEAAAGKARESADSLERLIARCKPMDQEGRLCLSFRPSLSESLGNTVDQLLEAAGLGAGTKSGNGSGGGFSQRRSSLRNVGLYGNRPTGRPAGGRGGRRLAGAGAPGSRQGPDRANPGGLDSTGRLQASGAADAAVPSQYKRKVGEYFQRVADELGDQ